MKFVVGGCAIAALAGCAGPAEGEPLEAPAKDGGTAQGRLQTDQGAEEGVKSGAESPGG